MLRPANPPSLFLCIPSSLSLSLFVGLKPLRSPRRRPLTWETLSDNKEYSDAKLLSAFFDSSYLLITYCPPDIISQPVLLTA